MRKLLLVFAFILGCGITLSAQDLITKKDGTDIPIETDDSPEVEQKADAYDVIVGEVE